MNNQHLVYRTGGRALLAASLLGVAYATASAQGTVGPPPVVSPEVATLVGTVSVTQLSARANREALQAQQNAASVEMPKHLLPDGSLTSAPTSENLKALPLTPEPTVGVETGISRPFKRIRGFTGIFAGENALVNGSEFEPPDQGLAVHDNVIAEINNLLVQFFKADGTPLTNPIAASAFFLSSAVGNVQAFFDPTSRHWFFDTILGDPSNPFDGNVKEFGLASAKRAIRWGSILSIM